jgi:hypothetical protein
MRAFLDQPLLAVLATLRGDDSVLLSPISRSPPEATGG